MQRRHFLLAGLLSGFLMKPSSAAAPTDLLENAAQLIARAVADGQVESAVIVARCGSENLERAYGKAKLDSSFLLGSISKPICVAAVMSLYDQRAFSLDDPAHKFLNEFRGDGREQVTIRHLLTHVSGLPDQLPENANLRRSHASLGDFAQAAMRVPLGFAPGTKYEYSSMAILLATEIAQRLASKSIADLVQTKVLQPLGMSHSALGLGNLKSEDTVPVQIARAAIEAGGGDPNAKDWDWNSSYWRNLGAPWGGVHASAGNVLKFLEAFVEERPGFLSAATTQLMIRNHNVGQLVPRGLGFALGPVTICSGCSTRTFGHTGSTGTLAWLDPERNVSLVVLTSLPSGAVKPHPRDLASNCLTSNQ